MNNITEWTPPNFDAIPKELKEINAWVVWRAEPNGEDKPRKVPYSARTGKRVKVIDPRSGCSFGEAMKAYDTGEYTGVGIVLDAAPGLAGVDLDKCVGPDRAIQPWAEEIVLSLASYAEVSPSGTGLRVFGLGRLPPGRRRKGNVEMYDGKRYLTVTGDVYVEPISEASYPVRNFQEALAGLHSRTFGTGPDDADPAPIDLDAFRGTSRLSDEEVLRQARKAKNGQKFTRLYDEGDWRSDYDSQSDADLALCGMLTFYTGGDPDQIERLFNESALNRGKWSRQDYRNRTIGKVVENPGAVFGPQMAPGDDFVDPHPGGGGGAGEDAGPAPDFPLDALPGAVAGFVKDTSERMGCPPEMVAVPALVALAGCIGREPRIAPKRNDTGWTERACLWGAVVAQKGSMKSPAQRAALGPLYRIQKRYWERYQREMSEWEEAERSRKLLLKARGKGAAPKEGDDAGSPDPETETPKPVAVRPVVDDITVEAVVKLMPGNPRLTLATDELSGFIKNMGRYNRGDDRGFWLQAHTSGPTINDRKGSGTVFVEDSYVNIIGGIQPKVLKDVFFSKEGADDGFLERFGLLAYPERSIARGEDRKPDREIRDRYYEVCERLFEAEWREVLGIRRSDPEDGPCSLVRFGDEAQDGFDRWLDGHMENLVEMGESPLVGFLSKSRGLLCRLALVLHLVRWASGEESEPGRVSLATLDGAIRLVDGYFAPMWRRAVLGSRTDWVSDLHGRLRGRLRERGEEHFTRRDLARLNWKGLGDEAAVDRFLGLAVSRGLAREEPQPSGERGGRPTVRYSLV